MKLKIKNNDQILVIKGKDRGKTGKVIKVVPKMGLVVVEKVNLKRKSVRPKKSGEKGEIVSIPAPLSIAKVKLLCPNCGKASRTGSRREAGKSVRYCKKCKNAV